MIYIGEEASIHMQFLNNVTYRFTKVPMVSHNVTNGKLFSQIEILGQYMFPKILVIYLHLVKLFFLLEQSMK